MKGSGGCFSFLFYFETLFSSTRPRVGISQGKQKSCSEVIYWFCFPARGPVLIYFAVSPEASSRLKCRHCMLGWTKYWQENTFGSFNWKNILLLSPRGQGSATAAQGGQGMHTSVRCSASHLLWEHKGPQNQLWGPTRPREQFLEGRWAQQPFQVGKLGLSLLLTKLGLFTGATMARLHPSFSFASLSCSQRAPGAEQAATALGGQCWSQQGWQGLIPSGDAPHQKQERLPHADPTSHFSVHTFTSIIHLENEFSIPKKYLHPQSDFQPLRCSFPFLWQVKGSWRRQW